MWMEILGVWAFAIAGGVAVSAVLGLLLTVLVGIRWRPPIWFWLLGPAITLTLGAIGTWSYGARSAAAIATVDPGMKSTIAWAAYGESIPAIGFGAVGAGLALIASACALAAALAASTRPGRFTFGPAVLSTLVAGATLVVGVVTALISMAGLYSLGLAVLAGIAALAPAVGGLRAAPPFSYDDEVPSPEPARIAAGRIGVALLSVLGVAAIGWGAGWLVDSSAALALAHVDPAQKATILASSIAEQISLGRVLIVALIGTLVSGLIPALWSSGDLGTGSPARNAVAVLGTMAALAAGVGIPFALASTLAPLLDLAGQTKLIGAIGGADLPEPKPRSADAWNAADGLTGGCVMTPTGTGWGFRSGGGACPEQVASPIPEEVVVAVQADMVATGLTRVRWGDAPADLRILVRRSAAEELPIDHPFMKSLAYGVVPFVAPPATDMPPVPEVYIVETPAGAQIAWADRPSIAAPTDSEGLRGLVDAGLPVVIVPGASWTVQDLVGWCLDVRAIVPGAVCGLRANAPLYVDPSLEVVE